MNLKEILKEKVKGFKSIQPKSKRFDDIREELETYEYLDLKETIWNILNDFPEHKCKECKKDTKFNSYQFGYKDFCDVKCSNKFKGKDNELNKRISKSVSKFNQSATQEFWDNRTKTHKETLENQPQWYRDKKSEEKSKYVKEVHKNRTMRDKALLNEKISHSVKYSKKAIKQRVERAKLGAQALNEYRSILKEQELADFNKQFNLNESLESYKELWDEYYNLVWYYTKKDLNEIQNIEFRGIKHGYSLDHKYSIKQGFLDGISPEIIGSNHNLEIITIAENSSKGAKCSITKEELLNLFNS